MARLLPALYASKPRRPHWSHRRQLTQRVLRFVKIAALEESLEKNVGEVIAICEPSMMTVQRFGVKDSGVWEIDALTAAWAVMSGINPDRGRIVFDTAISVPRARQTPFLLGWPSLREDTKPYLGRSSHYPEGVRENGMYSHGVQWLVKAARILVEQREIEGDEEAAAKYRETTYRLWRKITPAVTRDTGRDRDLWRPAQQAGCRYSDNL